MTTRDKVELALRRVLPRYTSTEQVLAAVGVFLAFGVALVTSDFRQIWFVPPDVWVGLFLAGALISGVWMLLEIRKWRQRPDIAKVVDEVLETSDRVPQ